MFSLKRLSESLEWTLKNWRLSEDSSRISWHQKIVTVPAKLAVLRKEFENIFTKAQLSSKARGQEIVLACLISH